MRRYCRAGTDHHVFCSSRAPFSVIVFTFARQKAWFSTSRRTELLSLFFAYKVLVLTAMRIRANEWAPAGNAGDFLQVEKRLLKGTSRRRAIQRVLECD